MSLLAAVLPVLTTNTALLAVDVGTSQGTASVGAYGRNGRPALRLTNAHAMTKPLTSALSTMWLNVALKASLGVSDFVILHFMDGSSDQATVSWGVDGLLHFTGTASTVYAAPAVDHVLDIRFVCNNTTGAWKVYLDGNATAALDVSGLDTQATGAAQVTQIKLGKDSSLQTSTLDFEHMLAYSETDTGDGFTGRLGSVVMDPQRPDGAGDQTQGTPSAGLNWQCEDDTDADSSADNVAFSAAGGDRYTLTNVAFTVGATKAVLVAALMSKDDAGTVTARTQIKSGATVATGATVSIASTDAYVIQAYGTDPATAAAFTPAGLNSLLAGPERVS